MTLEFLQPPKEGRREEGLKERDMDCNKEAELMLDKLINNHVSTTVEKKSYVAADDDDQEEDYELDDYLDIDINNDNNDDEDDESPFSSTSVSRRELPLRHSQCLNNDILIKQSLLPNFKPAAGCTDASDFVVRCFVARLRAGITVVKHGRSRWCKSRLRILHLYQDGYSLSWTPGENEPPTSKNRKTQLDLRTCTEVRHAWSPDPLNPVYTGTPILRQKCEAANAHKSFALIFPKRTVDMTACTADQCKVLMEGFSALCYRLQLAVANETLDSSRRNKNSMFDTEDGLSTTASATLTNTSKVVDANK